MDGFEPEAFARLQDQPPDASGAYQLAPGAYELEAASYCLHAGTHGPSKGDGYLYAPLEGTRSSVVRSILQHSVSHREVPQQDIQVLLWAILARTSLHDMPRAAQAAAARLLTPAQLLELGGSAFRATTPGIWGGTGPAVPPAMARVLHAESRLRELFTHADTPYAEFERVAVLFGDPERDPFSRNVPRGRWSSHPDGYFIRFFPSGYSETRIQVYVPEPKASVRQPSASETGSFRFASQAATPGDASAFGPAGTVRVDLSEAVAVPAETGRQRLAMSGRAH